MRGSPPRGIVVSGRQEPPPPGGRVWHRVDELLEPQSAREQIEAGTTWLVEWCGSAPAAGAPEELGAILADTVGARKVRKYRTKRSVPTVFIAEEWADNQGDHLVLFVEQEPAPRADPGPKHLPVP
jgi:hypothetical protein